jgi:TPP-dependent trihydroxycyclohexane-1,2-dione (THcHDO) dehydratase
VYSDPAHPEQNGRHERMHRDLKGEATTPPCFDLRAQQRKFNTFVHEYNFERPHAALELETLGTVNVSRLTVVASGDGAFGFNAIEIDTAVRHKVPLLIVVANNGGWQIETHDPLTNYGTVVGTKLQYSDYASMAKAFRMYAERVECSEDLPDAIERALTHQTALIDVLITPDSESADGKSGLAIVPDLQPISFWDKREKEWRNYSI